MSPPVMSFFISHKHYIFIPPVAGLRQLKRKHKMQPEIFKHQIPIQVRFNDLDLLGHVTNAVYQVYYSQAGVSYFQNVMEDDVQSCDTNFVMATITIDYHKSIMFHSKIAVQTRVERLGRKSFSFISQIVDVETGELYSRMHAQEICYSRKLKETVPMPDKWRKRILAYEPTPPRLG